MCIYRFPFVVEGPWFQCMPPVLWTISKNEEVLRFWSQSDVLWWMLSPLPTQSTANLHFFLGRVHAIWHPNRALWCQGRGQWSPPPISTETAVSCSQLRIVTYTRFFYLPWPFSFAVFPRKQHAIWGMETRLPQFLLYIKWSSQQLCLRAAFLLVKSWLSSILFSGEQKFFNLRAERPLPRISSTLPLRQVLSLLLETLTHVINCPWAQSCLWLVSRGSEWNTFTWQLKLPLIFFVIRNLLFYGGLSYMPGSVPSSLCALCHWILTHGRGWSILLLSPFHRWGTLERLNNLPRIPQLISVLPCPSHVSHLIPLNRKASQRKTERAED